ncbi:MAG: carboxypeptidase-like regulatory domain-containing protein [Pyrinomonadaceae bacterium]
MRKFIAAALIAGATFSAGFAQGTNGSENMQNVPNMGQAPKVMNGIGRLDLRVMDQNGNPVKGAQAKLESRRTDGFFCESRNFTDARGVSVLPPLHMGDLKLIVKAKGFQTQTVQVSRDALGQPVRVTLVAKK